MEQLPGDLVEHILRFVPVARFARCACVSSLWSEAVRSEVLWEYLVHRDFGAERVRDMHGPLPVVLDPWETSESLQQQQQEQAGACDGRWKALYRDQSQLAFDPLYHSQFRRVHDDQYSYTFSAGNRVARHAPLSYITPVRAGPLRPGLRGFVVQITGDLQPDADIGLVKARFASSWLRDDGGVCVHMTQRQFDAGDVIGWALVWDSARAVVHVVVCNLTRRKALFRHEVATGKQALYVAVATRDPSTEIRLGALLHEQHAWMLEAGKEAVPWSLRLTL